MSDESPELPDAAPFDFRAFQRRRLAELERHVTTLDGLMTLRLEVCVRDRIELVNDDVFRALAEAIAIMKGRAENIRASLEPTPPHS